MFVESNRRRDVNKVNMKKLKLPIVANVKSMKKIVIVTFSRDSHKLSPEKSEMVRKHLIQSYENLLFDPLEEIPISSYIKKLSHKS